MEFNISVDRKRTTVDNLIEQCEVDIYRLSLSLNLSPETLDINWTIPTDDPDINQNTATQLEYELGRLKALQARRESLG